VDINGLGTASFAALGEGTGVVALFADALAPAELLDLEAAE
jgi:hypothetical protein